MYTRSFSTSFRLDSAAAASSASNLTRALFSSSLLLLSPWGLGWAGTGLSVILMGRYSWSEDSNMRDAMWHPSLQKYFLPPPNASSVLHIARWMTAFSPALDAVHALLSQHDLVLRPWCDIRLGQRVRACRVPAPGPTVYEVSTAQRISFEKAQSGVHQVRSVRSLTTSL
eukprot:3530053-Rhodomonas_salina.1